MMAAYLCKKDVLVKHGGEHLPDPAFLAGKSYECTGMRDRDYVFINESGGEHLIPSTFLKKYFEVKD